ncbi:MAG: hypothetical protein KBG20_00655 [Caldilineaceae bacterium]|nr:hypothetical protein [Caldilineaceae bacterium]MBP8109918.1 hypothetical protein [Caldilineaceae bacterium]MBP8121114.1 hypothetical protein [Caldilineaceae bacterium]MBP9070769.1 hypothetical protein [Caldilineaceae bacterium]
MKQTLIVTLILISILVVAGCSSTDTATSEANPTAVPPSAAATIVPAESAAPVDAATPVVSDAPTAVPAEMGTSATVTIKGEVWADNWFAFYLGDMLVKEDSVSITTERSFNAETFTFEATYPLTLNFIAKDFKENDTGLEYIGTNRQQMGDGGLIAQFTDLTTGDLIAATDATWACTVIHEAPLDKSCENASNPVAGVAPCTFTAQAEPDGWMDPAFDVSGWDQASVFTAAQVSPKDGYNEIRWDSAAQLIWGPDLETSNTILCRLTVAGE